jgi:uncharacterized OB-fold protein
MEKFQPRSTDVSAPYWAGCRDGQLRLQYCQNCGQYQFYPRTLCAHCQHRTLEWRDASGNGRVASYTVVRRGVTDAYPAPYVIALIDLEEGPRMMSTIVDVDPGDISVGDDVTVDFAPWSDETVMPVFRRVTGSEQTDADPLC